MEGGHLRSGMSKVWKYKEAAWVGMPHCHVTHHWFLSFSSHQGPLGWGESFDQLTEKEKPKLGSQTGCFYMWCKPKMTCCYSTALEVVSESLPNGRALGGMSDHSICAGKEVAWGQTLHGSIGNDEWLGCLARGLEREKGEDWCQGGLGEGNMIDMWEWVWTVKIYVACVNSHQTAATIEEALKDQVDGTTWPVNGSQSL